MSLVCLTCNVWSDEFTNSNVLAYVNASARDVAFQNGQLVLNENSSVVIYNSVGYVVFKNDNVKVVDCSSWQSGVYSAVINNYQTFKFAK